MLSTSARVMNTSKSIELFSGGGAVSVLGNGGCWCCCCCFLAAVRFFVDDGMVAGVGISGGCASMRNAPDLWIQGTFPIFIVLQGILPLPHFIL